MKAVPNIPSFAFLGSVVVHAAAGGALAALGSAAAEHPLHAATSLVVFETIEPPAPPSTPPAPEPEPPVLEKPRIASKPRALRAPVREPEPPPEPAEELPPAPAPAVETTPAPASVAAPAMLADAPSASAHGPLGPASAQPITAPAKTALRAPRAAPVQTADLSRPARLADGARWDCPFPAEAESEGIERAQAVLRVVVEASGRLKKVEVKADPGHGFGDAARRCAMRRRWVGRQDHRGVPAAGEVTVVVQFERS